MPVLATVAPPVPSSVSGGAEVIAVVVLLSEFAMLRAPLLRSQVRLYALQSLAVSGLAIFVATVQRVGDLYILAALSFVVKVVVVPSIILRLLRGTRVDLATSHRLGVATMVLIAIAVSAFGFFVVGNLPLRPRSLPAAPVGIAAAAVLVAFVLVILRADVLSQAVGFFSLENGVSVTSIVLAAGLPLIVEVAFLFDLLVAVMVFGVLMRVHHARARTLSTDVLERLRG